MTGTADYWLEDLPGEPGDYLLCPRCGRPRFTACRTPYGVQLACWGCPTYIGIRAAGSAS